MPSTFDHFGKFETSLRSYNNKDLKECEPHPECSRPHCSNDIPLDPRSKLSQGMPFGQMVSYGSSDTFPLHKCSSTGCDEETYSSPRKESVRLDGLADEVTRRLYSTPTRASYAKLKNVGRVLSASTINNDNASETSDDTEKSLGSTASSVDGGGGMPQLVSQLVTAVPPGSHNQSRCEGTFSPSASRRSLSARGRRNVSLQRVVKSVCKRSSSSCAAPNIKQKAARIRNGEGARLNDSFEATYYSSEAPSSPDANSSPVGTPTPRKMPLSPHNSGSSGSSSLPMHGRAIPSSPRVVRPSAAFARGNSRALKSPLLKSNSDSGVRSLRGSFRRGKCKDSTANGYDAKVATGVAKSKLFRIFSGIYGSDELMINAHMIMKNVSQEHRYLLSSFCAPVESEKVEDSEKVINGLDCKNVALMIQREMEQLNRELVCTLCNYFVNNLLLRMVSGITRDPLLNSSEMLVCLIITYWRAMQKQQPFVY